MEDLISELSWRGLLYDKTQGVDDYIKQGSVILYIGFDPTADSLHIGNLIAILVIFHFQKYKHKILIVIGGGTVKIGDPSYRKKKRTYLSEKNIYNNIKSIETQINFLFRKRKNSCKLLNNNDWLNNISFFDFLIKIGRFITVNYMISKESVKKRLKDTDNDGMSFTEFNYQLFQGYDFLYLNDKENCSLQIGGSDQWGNITTGIEIIKRKTGKTVHGLTFPLITNSNGIKFGKTQKGNNIWIDSLKTKPYDFYQFWINISDYDAEKFIKMYTLLSKYEIKKIIECHKKNPSKRLIQNALAKEVTTLVHGQSKYEKIFYISNIIFNDNIVNFLEKLDDKKFLFFFSENSYFNIRKEEFKKKFSIIDLLVEKTNIFNSKNEARRALNTKSILLNKKSINDNFIIEIKDFISDRYMVLQYGKKRHFIIKIS